MKKIDKNAAQGDLVIVRVAKLPDGLKKTDSNIIGHSETGHHHVAVGDVQVYDTVDPLLSFMVTRGEVNIEHQKNFDVHESFQLFDGSEPEVVWEIHRQRENTPDGWKKVVD